MITNDKQIQQKGYTADNNCSIRRENHFDPGSFGVLSNNFVSVCSKKTQT